MVFSPDALASESHVRRERAKARELRASQWWRQQLGPGLCFHCGEKFSKSELTMDHLLPISRGGKSTKRNVVASCRPCNSKKRNWTRSELSLFGDVE